MKRLLVNDYLTTIPGTRTFWHDLQDWFDMEFVGGDYGTLAEIADAQAQDATLIIRNASWFPPMKASDKVPTISLLQDILTEGPQRRLQDEVMLSTTHVVYNSLFTETRYSRENNWSIIPLPVDFSLFEPGNAMGLQQALSLPDSCVLWIGASQGAAGQVKGYDTFLSIVRTNPDIPFVAVFKDTMPPYCPPNLRMYERVAHEDLVRIIGACRVGLCTSRMESQHLAGIEMGACGLPLVASPVGTYWKRDDMPSVIVGDNATPEVYTTALRATLKTPGDPQQIRHYWQRSFDKPMIRHAWTNLINEVEDDKR